MSPPHSVVDEVVTRHLARLALGAPTSVKPTYEKANEAREKVFSEAKSALAVANAVRKQAREKAEAESALAVAKAVQKQAREKYTTPERKEYDGKAKKLSASALARAVQKEVGKDHSTQKEKKPIKDQRVKRLEKAQKELENFEEDAELFGDFDLDSEELDEETRKAVAQVLDEYEEFKTRQEQGIKEHRGTSRKGQKAESKAERLARARREVQPWVPKGERQYGKFYIMFNGRDIGKFDGYGLKYVGPLVDPTPDRDAADAMLAMHGTGDDAMIAEFDESVAQMGESSSMSREV